MVREIASTQRPDRASLSHILAGGNSERNARVTVQNVLCSIIHPAIAAQEDTLGLQNCWKATSMNSVVTYINASLEMVEGCFHCGHPKLKYV